MRGRCSSSELYPVYSAVPARIDGRRRLLGFIMFCLGQGRAVKGYLSLNFGLGLA